jgi:predicted nucleic acid-binding protein
MLLDSNILIDLPLVTRNEEDFKHLTGLRVVNPFASTP